MTGEGERLRDEGMARALEAARAEWRELARDAIQYLATTGRPFTSEDVTRLAGMPCPGATEANKNNAVGGIIAGAARRREIRRVGEDNANRPSSHAASLKVWEGVRDHD